VTTSKPNETTIYFAPELRRHWPDPLASQWLTSYPHLFDADDLRITRRQPKNHFHEWLAAIHLFQRDGLLALVEKYTFANHPRKRALLSRILDGDQRRILDDIHREFRIQLPDLLVYAPDYSAFHFAEVKGPGDTLRPIQSRTHEAIRRRLGVPVEMINVRLHTPLARPPAT
jgi:hypothetical protein